MYFTVSTADGEPLPGLTAERFNIYEDGRLISTYESQQTILNPEVAAERYTLLLLDMSGSVVESGQVPLIQQAASAFVANVGDQEKVAVYAFDGRAEIQEISGFDDSIGRSAGGLNRLGGWRTEDPSTNLYGAVVEASRVLTEAQEASEAPLRFGTLVVFTDGTDRAHRATRGQALRAVSSADIGMFTIGLGGEVDRDELQELGVDGYVHAEAGDTVVQAFEQIAGHIQLMASAYYLLSYCSPSRAGTHRLEIEAVHGDQRGRASFRFDATDFDSGCDPNTPPGDFEVPGIEDAQRQNRRGRGRGSRRSRPRAFSIE
jgi:hypothetical protein